MWATSYGRAGKRIRLKLSAFDGKPRIRANFSGRAFANYLIDTGCPDDADLQPKPAFTAMLNSINSALARNANHVG